MIFIASKQRLIQYYLAFFRVFSCASVAKNLMHP